MEWSDINICRSPNDLSILLQVVIIHELQAIRIYHHYYYYSDCKCHGLNMT